MDCVHCCQSIYGATSFSIIVVFYCYFFIVILFILPLFHILFNNSIYIGGSMLITVIHIVIFFIKLCVMYKSFNIWQLSSTV